MLLHHMNWILLGLSRGILSHPPPRSNCTELLPKSIAPPCVPACPCHSVHQRCQKVKWRPMKELYTAMGARGRMYTPSTACPCHCVHQRCQKVNMPMKRALHSYGSSGQNVHFIYCQRVSVQPPTHWVFWNKTQPTRNWTDCPASECILVNCEGIHVRPEFWNGWGGAKDDKDCNCLTNCNNHTILHTSFVHSISHCL